MICEASSLPVPAGVRELIQGTAAAGAASVAEAAASEDGIYVDGEPAAGLALPLPPASEGGGESELQGGEAEEIGLALDLPAPCTIHPVPLFPARIWGPMPAAFPRRAPSVPPAQSKRPMLGSGPVGS